MSLPYLFIVVRRNQSEGESNCEKAEGLIGRQDLAARATSTSTLSLLLSPHDIHFHSTASFTTFDPTTTGILLAYCNKYLRIFLQNLKFLCPNSSP
jgi:hypothetical protein